ncbi:hypothetical protein [Arenibacter algicola]|uniref:Uncharacterized protein n=1 Tax=Arenibacter algicola TaxID=616991 RepID=A0A221UZ91_9FLAO|nr:hypothetical protein [Arenibacter algicola]ASO06679.1 hypothetical protein AREALGSMS7_03254 [Arenibacter algicola]
MSKVRRIHDFQITKKIPVLSITQNPFCIDYNENQHTFDDARRDKSRFSLF